ncbi:SURF1 family protein [Paralimibaculum aggregatum]|uniref:SURF1-like protein n=1 Tax=Paralimibaculum aggregatum TaxID=3036245 RepID=A0ABQ6LME7_9RHOB|nr:SURF1 family protein [Limibaculum sp. NKW23]GMG81824.1 SURF1 family protein [Limibaculum sp. NKW23]
MAVNRRAIAPILLGVVGVAVLLGLSAWQVQRLAWKEGLIARLEARLAAAPAALPAAPDPERDAFLRVALEGRLAPGMARVLTTRRPHGPGYRVIAPVETADGRLVLADLGYVPEAEAAGALPAPGTPITLTGALFWAAGDAFTPEPDAGAGLFFSREVAPLAAALGTEPLLVVAERHSLGATPEAERLGVNLPNDHLGYALTWGGLALVWGVMSVLWLRRARRGA